MTEHDWIVGMVCAFIVAGLPATLVASIRRLREGLPWAVIRVASWILPVEVRVDKHGEWAAEIWHRQHKAGPTGRPILFAGWGYAIPLIRYARDVQRATRRLEGARGISAGDALVTVLQAVAVAGLCAYPAVMTTARNHRMSAAEIFAGFAVAVIGLGWAQIKGLLGTVATPRRLAALHLVIGSLATCFAPALAKWLTESPHLQSPAAWALPATLAVGFASNLPALIYLCRRRPLAQ